MCDNEISTPLCNDESLILFPVIWIHHGNDYIQYEGQYSLMNIYMWIKSRLIVPYLDITASSKKQIRKMLRDEQMVYIYYYDRK